MTILLLTLLKEPLSLLEGCRFGIDFSGLLVSHSLRFIPLPLYPGEIFRRLLGQLLPLVFDLGEILSSFLGHLLSFLLDQGEILGGLSCHLISLLFHLLLGNPRFLHGLGLLPLHLELLSVHEGDALSLKLCHLFLALFQQGDAFRLNPGLLLLALS